MSKFLGEMINEKDRCKVCQGRKVIKESKILEVHVDKGMRDGQKITFRGEGDQMVRKRFIHHIIYVMNVKIQQNAGWQNGLCLFVRPQWQQS